MRRPFLSSLSFVLTCCLASLLQASEPSAPQRPNIVLIMADDMGFSDLGCYGSEIATPNLDRLAAGGLRFTQFYNTARCCPTRAALLTGLYSHQAGVGHMVEDRGAAAYRGFLNERCVTIAEALKPAGYVTYLSGKWHVGEDRPHWPVDRGFDHSYSLVSGGTNYFRLDPGRKLVRDDQLIEPPGDWYITDAISEAAAEFVAEHGPRQEPFFLYVAYTAPHWPLHAHADDIAKYRGRYREGWDALRQQRQQRMIELGIVDARWPLTPRDPDVPAWTDVKEQEAYDLKMAVYAAQIDRMDQGIGMILDQLEKTGADRNTLVLFLADNGGCAEEIDRGRPGVPPGPADSFLRYGLPWANASNTPFRLYKHWVHEGGIATPLIAWWPGVIQAGGLTHEPGHVIDLMATCLDVSGAEYPQTHRGHDVIPLEGRSLVPVLAGGTRPGHEAIFWEHEGNRAVRQGPWKLVSRFPGDWELYNLAADRTELTNLAVEQPDKVRELAGLYEQWAARSVALPWPQVRTASARGAEPMVVTPGERQLFLDNDGIANYDGLARVLHQPTKFSGNPVVGNDRPWQTFRAQLYGTALYDPQEKLFRMWYLAGARLPFEKSVTIDGRVCCPNFQSVGYAVSRDGLHFELPDLGLVNFNGSTANNLCRIARECAEGIAVVDEPASPNPRRRFKALYWEHFVPYQDSPGVDVNGMSVSFSPDGTNWTDYEKNPVMGLGSDTGQQVLWDPKLNKYVAYGRFGAGGRRVARSQSDDFVNWSQPEVVFQADHADGAGTQIYGMGISIYEGQYLALPWMFHEGTTWNIDVQLAASRDGIHWRRVADRQTFLPNGPEGAWDAGIIFTASQPLVVVDDTIYIYYSASRHNHDYRLPAGERDAEWWDSIKTSIGVATLRRDGFVSLDAGDAQGRLRTRPFELSAGNVSLNVAAPSGEIRVELLDNEGRVVAASAPLTGDRPRVQVEWQQGSLDSYQNQTVSLRFKLRNAKLYSYWVHD